MSYRVKFAESALRSWNKLGSNVRVQFEKALQKRVENPHVPAARLHALPSAYKIKLRSAGYRLVYQVLDDVLIVYVIGVGRRDEGYEVLLAAGQKSLDEFD